MTNQPVLTPEMVACEICLKEVSSSESGLFEIDDYVANFCGLECYTIWKARTGTPLPEAAGEPRRD